MDNTKLKGMAEAILAAIDDKNYPAARDLCLQFYKILADLVIDNEMIERYGKDWLKVEP